METGNIMNIKHILYAIRNFGYTKTYIVVVLFFFANTFLSIFFSVGILGTFHIFTNTSDSMLPTINRGSLTFVVRMVEDMYEPGDIITFSTRSIGKAEIISHRIIRRGGNVYITKGDHNQAIDAEPVIPRLIIGKVVMIIPLLGYWITFIKSQIGIFLLIYLPAAFILIAELAHIAGFIPHLLPKKRNNHTPVSSANMA